MKRRIEPFEAPRIGSRAELINGTWYWIDDQPEPDSDKCPSCGVPYTEHLGLIGTCKRVKELTADRDRLHVLLSCAHGALADCGLPVPGLDHDIAPVIRAVTEQRDSYKRLARDILGHIAERGYVNDDHLFRCIESDAKEMLKEGEIE